MVELSLGAAVRALVVDTSAKIMVVGSELIFLWKVWLTDNTDGGGKYGIDFGLGVVLHYQLLCRIRW